MEEKKIVGVRFKSVGKVYYFSTNVPLKKLDAVIVETARGLELGEVVTDMKELSEFNLDMELKPIIRIATKEDLEKEKVNEANALDALAVCKKVVKKHKLDMNLIHCEYTHDASKVIFMYTSEERVDFRELLKELASIFRCRIELRQIGPRDKAKLVGGLGTCGLPLCCSSFLGEFDGVSINMAKNQMLAINIEKISGACGRLMCCLKYEDEAYSEAKKHFPKIGSRVIYNDHTYKVLGTNILNKQIKIEDNGNILFVDLSEIKQVKPKQ
ncbi:PSP1 domain-containing protein [Beduini massiliensis]|uniref:PSP1 domain-containing protein n=1 Tax=Beduini massiliensis TaxID=1585974 RepID=UPI00059A7CCE|nr:stage 0 sporulation family protein [Beduini massiliensis]